METLWNLQMNSSDSLFNIEGSPYEKRKKLGSGTYGIVYSAVDQCSGHLIAVKKVCNIFDNLVLARRTYREIRILRHLVHDNVIHLREILRPPEKIFSDVYLVFDLMDTDLHQVIHSQQQLTDEHVRYFLYQILRGLKYIHSANIIHRDLKPSNMLVNENCDLKIGDFGMARAVNCHSGNDPHNNELLMTQYVMTRWYRAPELMLFRRQYTVNVDMWSVGCIFAEMLARRAIFRGSSLIHQVTLIVNTLGSPDMDFISLAHADRIKDFLHNLKVTESTPLNTQLPSAHPKSLRLLQQMLRWNPTARISVDSALRDLYLNHYHNPSDEPVCTKRLDFTFDEDKTNDIDELRRVICDEIYDALSLSQSVSSDVRMTADEPTNPAVYPCTVSHASESSVQKELGLLDHSTTRQKMPKCFVTSDQQLSSPLSSMTPSKSRLVHRRGNSERSSLTSVSAGHDRTRGAGRAVTAHRVILPASVTVPSDTSTVAVSSPVNAKARLRELILSGRCHQQRVKGRRQQRSDRRRAPHLNCDNTPVALTELTDEDKSLLKRWEQMQHQQPASDPAVTVTQCRQQASDSAVNVLPTNTQLTALTATLPTTAAAAGDAGDAGDSCTDGGELQLCSADSRLADKCLAGTQLIWSPSVSLSSADIVDCLNPSQATLSHTTTAAAAAAAADNSGGAVETSERCCAGYGIVELLPLSPSCESMELNNDSLSLLLTEEPPSVE